MVRYLGSAATSITSFDASSDSSNLIQAMFLDSVYGIVQARVCQPCPSKGSAMMGCELGKASDWAYNLCIREGFLSLFDLNPLNPKKSEIEIGFVGLAIQHVLRDIIGGSDEMTWSIFAAPATDKIDSISSVAFLIRFNIGLLELRARELSSCCDKKGQIAIDTMLDTLHRSLEKIDCRIRYLYEYHIDTNNIISHRGFQQLNALMNLKPEVFASFRPQPGRE